ncbi:hypothetical protein CAEBREN_05961 [Caenorhabditis brenneri]|uniref:Uncharacterized protein n=1 Tax=Caenorhabditis brenneri TaxID=135651 RepID=G0MHA8_CAEBE|nr:hypothetical protein CAEBREN_05961 [Caenorhabditis brenneri]
METAQTDPTVGQEDNMSLLLSVATSTNENSTTEDCGGQHVDKMLPTLAITDENSTIEVITNNEETIDHVAPVTNRIGQMSPILSTARIHLLDADSFDSNDENESKLQETSIDTDDTEVVDSIADKQTQIKNELGDETNGEESLVDPNALVATRLALPTENIPKIKESRNENQAHGGNGGLPTKLPTGDTERKLIETGTQTNLVGGMIENSGNIENTIILNSAEGVPHTTTSRLVNESPPNNGNNSRTIFFDPASITHTVTNRRLLHLPNTGIHTVRPTRRIYHVRNHQNFAGEFDREQARLNAEHRGIQNLLFQFFILMILALLVFGTAAVFALISKL